jgi:hypothetical protein
MPKTREKRASAGRANALQRPPQPSEELAEVVGSGPLPRGQVVSKIWEYIRSHNLQNPENRRVHAGCSFGLGVGVVISGHPSCGSLLRGLRQRHRGAKYTRPGVRWMQYPQGKEARVVRWEPPALRTIPDPSPRRSGG